MEQIVIETPEHVEFTYDLAGLGSRFLASFYDHLLLGGGLTLVFTAFLLVASQLHTLANPLASFGQNMVMAFLVLFMFLIYWGYFTFFEVLWNGQTPGKRLIGIRVIKAGGYPIRFTDVFLRNLFRVVDFLPAYYFLGAFLVFLDRRHRRLGDMVAQTLVVKERREAPPDLALRPSPDAPPASTPLQLQAVTEEMYNLVREFLLRREQLELTNRGLIARKLARPILAALNLPERDGIDYEEFLEELARQYREWRRL